MAWREQPAGRPVVVEPGNPALCTRSPLADLFTPVASSAGRPGWGRLLVERHETKTWEGQARLPFNAIVVLLRPPRRFSARLEGGRIRTVTPAPGDVIIVPADCMHWGDWEGPNDFVLAYLSTDTVDRAVRDDGLAADRLEIDYRFGAHDADTTSLMLALQTQLVGQNVADQLYVDTLGVQLAVHLLRTYGTTPLRLRSYRHGLSREKMRLVLEYLNAHLQRNIHLAELADLVEMSQFHFVRCFRAACGVTPHHYLVQRRVEVAMDVLLHEDVPLAEVAYRVGFADQSHFTRHFRRITGAPPGRVRRERRAH